MSNKGGGGVVALSDMDGYDQRKRLETKDIIHEQENERWFLYLFQLQWYEIKLGSSKY